jgi:hypothetical protein
MESRSFSRASFWPLHEDRQRIAPETRASERRRQQDAERQARAGARRAKIDDWIDQDLVRTLQRLDALTNSENESIALRAIRMKLDIAIGKVNPAPVLSSDPEIDAIYQAKERELLEQLVAADAGGPTDRNGAGK